MMPQKNWSLRDILTINYLFVSIIPIFLLSLFALDVLNSHIKKQVMAKDQMLAKSIANEVEVYLDQPKNLLFLVEKVYTDQDSRMNERLERIVEQFAILDTIQVVNLQGKTIYNAPYDTDMLGLDVSNRPYFAETLARQTPFWSSSFISLRTGQPTVTLSKRIPDGIIVLHLNLSQLSQIIADTNVHGQYYSCILGQRGTYLAHENIQKVQQRVLEPNFATLKDREGTHFITMDSQEVIASVAKVQEINWTVLVYQNKDQAYFPIRQITSMFILALLFSVLVASILGKSSTEKVIRPLKNLIGQTKILAQGNYNIQIEFKSYQEYNELAKNFNHMLETIQVRQQQLENTAKDLATTNKELEAFAYVVSHDLKAPLRAISNLSQWLEEDLAGHLPPEGKEMLEMLRGRVRRMEALINGILQYSRAGRLAPHYQWTDTQKLLEQIIGDIDVPETFAVTLQHPLPYFETETLLLSQVFSNLISNAVKHHDRTNGHVTISVGEAGEFYRFTVADDGPGIAPQYHEKIFGIFQTLQSRDTLESTGVGLALVKKIIEVQGCTYDLQSDVGQGVSVSFTWPKVPHRDGKGENEERSQ